MKLIRTHTGVAVSSAISAHDEHPACGAHCGIAGRPACITVPDTWGWLHPVSSLSRSSFAIAILTDLVDDGWMEGDLHHIRDVLILF